MKKMVWVFGMLLLPSALFGADIVIQWGGSCRPPVHCWPYPVFYPPYSYYGYAPYFYGPSPGYSYSSGSSDGTGRTIRLGEEHESFWDKHGGFEPASYSTVEMQPRVGLPSIDRRSPLAIGDAEHRIRDLDLDVDLIVASGDATVYHLADGRKVRAERGVILEIS